MLTSILKYPMSTLFLIYSIQLYLLPDAESSWHICWLPPLWCSTILGFWFRIMPPFDLNSDTRKLCQKPRIKEQETEDKIELPSRLFDSQKLISSEITNFKEHTLTLPSIHKSHRKHPQTLPPTVFVSFVTLSQKTLPLTSRPTLLETCLGLHKLIYFTQLESFHSKTNS